ncbi:uncharacterized protein FOMMEDRAFT_152150 [Fomitiporia mediterranea MF3/22]|uniref:uncharacterized protein n=1 Tax=Fomitiporia mediterranea (strain MF3/22) TaxID=694068 RepID=UPI00044082DA|nr:uncharacterized protein FOMMEDRAFT_152150 [Fomitiporia mediterranea MF3/22]EJD06834.1 hypothetical protein FOMMEDRAFT_152150 [Fomitiporia mediterranea MF3/22]
MAEAAQNILSIKDEIPPEKMPVFFEGKEHKEAGDKLVKTDATAALRKYYKVLLCWKGLSRQNPMGGQGESKPKSMLDEELGKVYSNMTLCQLMLKKYDRVIETADKALALNKDNYKALFRKAKALGELGYFEKAEPILNELLTNYPTEAPTIKAELESLRFLNSAKEIFDADSAPTTTGSEATSSAKIEDVDMTNEESKAKSLPTPELPSGGDASSSAKIEEVKDE